MGRVNKYDGTRDMRMPESGNNELTSGTEMKENITESPVFHKDYEVRDENGINIGIQLLIFYFGELWRSAMNRLNHKIDGHMFDIRHQGMCFAVYRNLKTARREEQSYLRLVE